MVPHNGRMPLPLLQQMGFNFRSSLSQLCQSLQLSIENGSYLVQNITKY